MKNVLLIGCGGIGSRVAYELSKLKGISVTAMDGDSFNERNLERQWFNKDQIGMSKAQAMEQLYGFSSCTEFLEEPRQIEGFMPDLVICCPDNNLCRRISIKWAEEYQGRVIIAGNRDLSANAIYYNPKMMKSPLTKYPELLVDEEKRRISCAEQVSTVPQTSLANAMAASFAMALFTFWIDNDLIHDVFPVEHIWYANRVLTINTSEF